MNISNASVLSFRKLKKHNEWQVISAIFFTEIVLHSVIPLLAWKLENGVVFKPITNCQNNNIHLIMYSFDIHFYKFTLRVQLNFGIHKLQAHECNT